MNTKKIAKIFINQIFICVFLNMCIGALAFATDTKEANSLEKINQKVNESEANLAKLEKESQDLKNEVAVLNQEVQKITNEKNKITSIREKNEEELKKLENKIQKLKEEIFKLIKRSRGRLRALYRERPIQDFLSFLFSNTNNNTDKVMYYVAKVRKYDKKLMEDLIKVKRELVLKINERQKIIAENKVLENKLIQVQKEEQVKLLSKKSALSLLLQKETLIEKELNELRAQALRIEIVLKSVTEGISLEDLDFKDIEKKEIKKKEEQLKRVEAFKGEGLLAKRGKIPLPVTGKVVKHFGKHQVKQFRDFVVSKGIEFEVDKDEEAKAVADGKVIYIGKMPGYGNMVILDHGKRYYTLYSHLEKISNNVGDIIEGGESFGTCQSNENGQPLFYFEIRKDGKPINPTLYLAS